MKKYKIHLDNTDLIHDPLSYLYNLFSITNPKEKSLEALSKALFDTQEDWYIEFVQNDVVHDDILRLVHHFEQLNIDNKHIHFLKTIM